MGFEGGKTLFGALNGHRMPPWPERERYDLALRGATAVGAGVLWVNCGITFSGSGQHWNKSSPSPPKRSENYEIWQASHLTRMRQKLNLLYSNPPKSDPEIRGDRNTDIPSWEEQILPFSRIQLQYEKHHWTLNFIERLSLKYFQKYIIVWACLRPDSHLKIFFF